MGELELSTQTSRQECQMGMKICCDSVVDRDKLAGVVVWKMGSVSREAKLLFFKWLKIVGK